jgi:hypothetical protein
MFEIIPKASACTDQVLWKRTHLGSRNGINDQERAGVGPEEDFRETNVASSLGIISRRPRDLNVVTVARILAERSQGAQ